MSQGFLTTLKYAMNVGTVVKMMLHLWFVIIVTTKSAIFDALGFKLFLRLIGFASFALIKGLNSLT